MMERAVGGGGGADGGNGKTGEGFKRGGGEDGVGRILCSGSCLHLA